MTPIEGARACVLRGWKVFPLRPRGKVPVGGVSWKTLVVSTVADVERLAKVYQSCNWAVDCEGSGLLVVDLDKKPNMDGEKSLSELADAEFQAIPKTLTVSTPRGGKHLYFLGVGPTRAGVIDAVDTRGQGGYVVAPGSVGADGKEYVETGGTVAPLPGWLAKTIGEARQRDAVQTPAVTQDGEASRLRAIEEARMLPAAVEGCSGDETTYRAACRLKDLGVSEAAAYEIMLVHFNPRCSPPWNDGQLAAKVANAYRYGKLQPGRESPDLFGPVPAAPAPEKSAPIHIGEFMADPKRMTWVVENWIPRQGHTFFSGRGGVGKSTMCLQLAVSIAAGRPWFGMGVTPMPTLVVACEDTQDEVHRRLHVIMNTPEYAGIDYKETPLHVWSRVGFNNIVAVIKDGEGVRPGKYHDELETHLKSMPEGPKFVVLDTIPDVFFGNENDRCSVNAFVKQILGRWEKLYNVTFLCTAHPPKSGAEFSGSTAWEGAFRSRLFCDYADPEHIDEFRTFKVSKANYGKAGTGMTLKRCDDGLFRPCADAEADEGMKQAIIFAVNDADSDGDPLCWSHQSPRCYHKICIKDRDGRPLAEEVVKRLVKEMIQEGRLETHGLSPRELRVVQGIPDSV